MGAGRRAGLGVGRRVRRAVFGGTTLGVVGGVRRNVFGVARNGLAFDMAIFRSGAFGGLRFLVHRRASLGRLSDGAEQAAFRGRRFVFIQRHRKPWTLAPLSPFAGAHDAVGIRVGAAAGLAYHALNQDWLTTAHRKALASDIRRTRTQACLIEVNRRPASKTDRVGVE
ncbi:hypothetical protein BURKHO8Y_120161 [Burkholderia sp. 8Y]|nr:hypothetical protein BURKHO8Y_120161 [Burkholderia sp. 8Y]